MKDASVKLTEDHGVAIVAVANLCLSNPCGHRVRLEQDTRRLRIKTGINVGCIGTSSGVEVHRAWTAE